MMKGVTEEQGIEGWVPFKITKALRLFKSYTPLGLRNEI